MKHIRFTLLIFSLLSFTSLSFVGLASASSRGKIQTFADAKRLLKQNLELFDHRTIYCGCLVKGKQIDLKSCGYKVQTDAKRAARMEWEHVVPAQAFGQSFVEWRESSPKCKKGSRQFKGRKCAETNPIFQKMEADLYNLFPEIGELNGLRNNFSMAALTGSQYDFGDCKAKIEDKKFEPMDFAKGIVARTYLNFEHQYPGHGVISNKNEKLFEAWNKTYPITELECKRWKALEPKQGYRHLFASQCR